MLTEDVLELPSFLFPVEEVVSSNSIFPQRITFIFMFAVQHCAHFMHFRFTIISNFSGSPASLEMATDRQ